ncbi:aldehyde dehydrogenase family protein [Bradyrhizobium sp.]|uniref:aldehyde dehydrogenase family protein n=1 Tax=Bradyrhizobium sp. TaxID=376 RepID=UPI001EBEEAB9|nr:aldehyde dehydrogenase family protein [Bradyrhizobium sp.]MBV9985714.1 aldehyde dehydrogenase family protein [Bradyrhizobium sp.]
MSNIALEKYWPNFIDGEFDHGRAGRSDVFDPSNGMKIAEHALADAKDVDRAVQAAQRVFKEGAIADLAPAERGRLVTSMGKYLNDHLEEIKRIISVEQGKLLYEADNEVKLAIRLFEYFGSMAESLEGRSVPVDNTRFDFTTYKPYGVSAQFIPGSFPVYLPARSIAVALVTGNCCVLKSSQMAPISLVWFARAAQSCGLPPGALNIICGRPEEAGAALATHPDINHLAFSGYAKSAAQVLPMAAANLIPSVVEVGGTNPTIAFEDADLDAFISAARFGSYWNAGQICSSMGRLIVHESIFDEVVERAVAISQSLQLRPGIECGEFGPYMGPLDGEENLEKVLDMVRQARRQGARCLTGGERSDGPGSFMQPTVFVDVDPRMPIAQEEIWGPVVSVLKFRDDAEAYRIANDVRHTGILCGIFTGSIGRLTRAAHAVRAGHIIANCSTVSDAEIPFGGGFGQSGYGRVKGREAMLGYVQSKNLMMPIGDMLPEMTQRTKAVMGR